MMDAPMRFEVDVSAGTSRMVVLSADELVQLDADQKEAAAQAVADAQAQAARDAIVAKLAAGKATDAEVQQALAEVLS